MERTQDEMLAWINRVEKDSLELLNHTFDIDTDLRNRGAYIRAADNPSIDAEGLIMLAQAHWMLKGDFDAAHHLLCKIPALAMLSVRAMRENCSAKMNGSDWDQSSLSYTSFVPLLVGLMLAGAKKAFREISEEIVSNSSFDHKSRGHIVGEFAFQIASMGAGKNDLISITTIEGTKGFKNSHFIYGYHEMLYHIAKNDLVAFERVRCEREAAFSKRSRSRIALDQLDTWGHGKVAQSVTFDALGTALCRLALWCGMSVNVNTRLYPKEFYAM